jgi:hypothetical protein
VIVRLRASFLEAVAPPKMRNRKNARRNIALMGYRVDRDGSMARRGLPGGGGRGRGGIKRAVNKAVNSGDNKSKY